MTASNIDMFNGTAGKVFANLYQCFPVPTEIHLRDFFDDKNITEPEQTSDFSPRIILTSSENFVFATVQWLISEGYISAAASLPTQVYFRRVVLTQKGLAVLNAVPDSLVNKQSIGDRLVASAKAGAMDVLKSAAKEALSIGIKSITG